MWVHIGVLNISQNAPNKLPHIKGYNGLMYKDFKIYITGRVFEWWGWGKMISHGENEEDLNSYNFHCVFFLNYQCVFEKYSFFFQSNDSR